MQAEFNFDAPSPVVTELARKSISHSEVIEADRQRKIDWEARCRSEQLKLCRGCNGRVLETDRKGNCPECAEPTKQKTAGD